jgi:hypothetical protein
MELGDYSFLVPLFFVLILIVVLISFKGETYLFLERCHGISLLARKIILIGTVPMNEEGGM